MVVLLRILGVVIKTLSVLFHTVFMDKDLPLFGIQKIDEFCPYGLARGSALRLAEGGVGVDEKRISAKKHLL
jgi:hypothetical protein